LPQLIQDCTESAARGYGLDNEEAEIDVGCIGVLIRDSNGNVAAGLSVSAPIERRRMSWVKDVVAAGNRISAQLGYRE
jgi:DNA-binding IclR family transcriptional regulator